MRPRRDRSLHDRVVWQSASLLLAYPDDGHGARLQTVAELIGRITGEPARLLQETLSALRQVDAMALATRYVDTFDLRKQTTMLLTYWTGGDTRNRGAQMVAFTQAYRAAGVAPPRSEAPDHLPVVLEFAAAVDPVAGRRLLEAHRVPISVLRQALSDADSPYASAVAAVCATLPRVDEAQVRTLLGAGPPRKSVGLEPFQLTVPPRRAQGGV
ncbi:nitrate reductase molybdenum cofactor assembly chaperone [Mycolicibacterium goodii]|uniref:Nitrate reductase n=1 Tax=Mycolicibacterium goodii TaxID=134601 RepID=A0A0K0X6M5_MYCGD|nr:nitrate reductase [Mycolicibacterium goodii]